MPTVLAETINEKAESKDQGVNREQNNAVKSFNRRSSQAKSTKSTPKVTVAVDTKAEGARDVEKKPASKPLAVKREPSDIFKSFSRPKSSLKRENTGTSAGASPAPTTAPSVRILLLLFCKFPNKA